MKKNNLDNNQKRSLRKHCNSVSSEYLQHNYLSKREYIHNLAYMACRKSLLARGKFIVDTDEAVEYCVEYLQKKYFEPARMK